MSDPIDTMARTIYGEARGEGNDGMEAVASVIMNRVDHPGWWGDTIENVCLTPYQFSCWNQGDPNRDIITAVNMTNPIFTQCMNIAHRAVIGKVDDKTGGANSYYDRRMSVPPKWSNGLEPTASIGHHLFFKL